ncbi:MAG: lipocalin-like domain-containing protein, partial [Alphaproteobacteria bacterium]|nr:lipocalin-like domain-containing protein [Alphaproteobacteria bacterium]
GEYTFNGQQLITKCDSASEPSRVNTDQIRDVSFDGDIMILRPPVRVIDGVAQQRLLRWEKIADV